MRIISISIVAFSISLIARDAVIITPITNALIVKAHSSNNQTIEQIYSQLTCMPTKESLALRAYQILFNTMVHVLKEDDDQVQIKVNNLFYDIDPLTKKPIQIFWIPKNAITYIDQLQSNIQKIVPKPLSYIKNYWFNPNVVVITLPWLSTRSQQLYSVGTRFIAQPECDTEQEFGITFYNPITHGIETDLIKKTQAYRENSIPLSKKRTYFIKLIQSWIKHAQQQGTKIPYVWGGASYNTSPLNTCISGFDCSSLILVAAQIIGVPFPYKTTMMIERFLKPLSLNETLEIGDLIWVPGHIMIVENLADHTVLQARGSDNGYGYVYSSPIKEFFKDILTFDDLIDAYFQQKTVIMLNRKGLPVRNYEHFKILKLFS